MPNEGDSLVEMITKSVACWCSLSSVNSHADLLGVENDRGNTDAIKENFLVTCPQHPDVNVEESLGLALCRLAMDPDSRS
jgi:hypothetical protein